MFKSQIIKTLFGVVGIAMLGTMNVAANAENHRTQQSNAPILVQGAMDTEIQELKAAFDSKPKETVRGSWTFWEGSIDGYPVVLSRTEIGMVNASASTTLGIELFKPRVIINQGTAGGKRQDLRIRDIVIGQSTVNIGSYDMPFRPVGEGFKPEDWEYLPYPTRLRIDGELVNFFKIPSDSNLVEKAQKHAKNYQSGKVVTGVIGSADQWNRELDRFFWFQEHYDLAVEDMESASSALVSQAYQIPFVAIRVISDNSMIGHEYDPSSGTDGQLFVLDFMKSLIQDYQKN